MAEGKHNKVINATAAKAIAHGKDCNLGDEGLGSLNKKVTEIIEQSCTTLKGGKEGTKILKAF